MHDKTLSLKNGKAIYLKKLNPLSLVCSQIGLNQLDGSDEDKSHSLRQDWFGFGIELNWIITASDKQVVKEMIGNLGLVSHEQSRS